MTENERINKLKLELNQLEAIGEIANVGDIQPPYVKPYSKLVYIMHISWVLFVAMIAYSEEVSGTLMLSIIVLGFALIMSMKSHDVVTDMANAGVQAVEKIMEIAEQGREQRIERIKKQIDNG